MKRCFSEECLKNLLYKFAVDPNSNQQTNNQILYGKAKTDPYCIQNQNEYLSNCNTQFRDDGKAKFCSEYGIRCLGWKRINQPAKIGQNPSEHKSPPVAVAPVQNPPKETNLQYCSEYGKQYYALCVKGDVADFAESFCNGYSKACPGVPPPGSEI